MSARNTGLTATTHAPSRCRPTPVELVWAGKGKREEVTKLAGRKSIGRNSIILGCLEEVLPSVERGSVDFVYLDPPFMTQKDFAFNSASHRRHGLRLVGRGGGHDENPVEEEATSVGTIPAGYSDRWCRRAYLDFLDAAFRFLKPALTETGSIAVHTDYRAAHWVRCLLDEHFSPDNFINELIWKYGLGNARSTRHFLRKHDNIAVYAASSVKRKYYFKMIRGEVTKAQKAKYCHEDEGGKYMLSYGKKYYLKGGKPLESVLDIPALSATSSERTGYPTQKPTELLRILIEAFCPPGGCVLDPCCGSGTTLVAAAETRRSWIGIDANADAVRTAKGRIGLAD